MANRTLAGCQGAAIHTVRTAYGPYHLCGECYEQGHLDLDAGRTARLMSPASNPIPASLKCECEHIIHFPEEN